MMSPLTRFAIGSAAAACTALSAVAGNIHAQSPGNTRPSGPRAATSSHIQPVPTATASFKEGSIQIDGRIDDAAWQQATPLTEFQQFDPDHGQPASEHMEVRFLYDAYALYVGARLFDKQGPDGVMSTVVRRDAFFNSDFFEVVIDGFHDHLGRAFFQVNPSGSRTDMQGTGGSCCDSGWDPVWESQTTIDSLGWTVEMRIPFSQLRFSRDSVQTWGLQVRRFLKRRNEMVQWSMWDRNDNGGPARFGHLEGVRIASSPRNLEILPYVASQASREVSAPNDPFHSGTQSKIRAGVDVKYLLTPNLTLDATINPDFGQVEVDPAVVNLSAFENFFSERRPFFVSGAGVFSFGNFNCQFCSNVQSLQAFYSRRIGRAPTGSDLAFAQGRYADVPQSSPVLGAAKVTGRTSSGYTVGLLNAVTGKTTADIQQLDGTRTSLEVEPLANYFVGRVKKDYRNGDLVLGVIGTSLTRSLSDEFKPRLSSHAELVGADWQYMWDNRAYSFIGSVAASSVAGDAAVITRAQRAPSRLFQRPGRAEGSGGFFSTKLDSTATVLRGYGAYARIGKNAGNWQWETAVNLRNPGFETNDYSFLTNTDYIWNNFNLIRAYNRPTSWYRNLAFIVGGQTQRNFEGDVTRNSDVHSYAGMTTPNFWDINAFVIRRIPGLIDDKLLRGGPAVRTEGSYFYASNISTDSRKQWQVSTNPSFSNTTLGGTSTSMNLQLRVQPNTRTSVSFGPSYAKSLGKQQYVTARADAQHTAFGGARYVFADIHQKSVGFDTRFNLTFTPTMTLELYAQPLLASGKYTDFKEFDAPRERGMSVYGVDVGTITAQPDSAGAIASYRIDPDGNGPANSFVLNNPDFNFRSLRGSAVFRWEYRPGSTLFFVWTQQRSDTESVGDFDFVRDRHALFSARPNNVFMIKASWWLAR
jgi:hypothetical protein